MPSFTRPSYHGEDGYAHSGGAIRSRMPRTAFILACAAVAMAFGFLGAWWLTTPAGMETIAAIGKLARPPGVAVLKTIQREPPKSYGISTGELPYDGQPPDATGRIPAPVIAEPASPPQEFAPMRAEPGIAPQEQPNEDVASSGNGKAVQSASGNAAGEKKQKRTAGMADAAVPSAVPQRDPARPARKRTELQNMARGSEIDRIQQQADEELKKKTARRRAITDRLDKSVRAGRSTAVKPAATSVSNMARRGKPQSVAALCARADGLIEREKCKWKACNGQWGKNGCPSYARVAGRVGGW